MKISNRGLYALKALTHLAESYDRGLVKIHDIALPNKISLFRFPLEADYPDPEDLEDEVRITVIHELAHHLGIDDDRLHELGFD